MGGVLVLLAIRTRLCVCVCVALLRVLFRVALLGLLCALWLCCVRVRSALFVWAPPLGRLLLLASPP